MITNAMRSAKTFFWVLTGLCLAVGGAIFVGTTWWPRPTEAAKPRGPTVQSLRLVPGKVDTLALMPGLEKTLGVRTVQVQSAGSHDHLIMSGSLILDSNRLVRVHSRFAGEVVSIGSLQPADGHASDAGRPLRLGDRVKKGQVLAVIWSKDVGEKKSDLVNALSKLYMDTAQLDSLRKLGKAVIAERQVREAEREKESDIIEVDRVERTLRSWRLTEPEIGVVRKEAEKIHFSKGDIVADMEVDKSWAEVEVRSPFEGIVLEKNIVAGDIVDTTLDLFKIADLSVLGVMANVYEEDLPALEALPPGDRRWTVALKSQGASPGMPGTFELIGNIVDPNQHTAAVMGWLDNRDGHLKAGQFVTATVDLPAVGGEVMVPDSALIEEGTRCVVFVAAKEDSSKGNEVSRRIVALISRGADMAFVRSQPTPEERARGCKPLLPGEWVVTAGGIELDGALENALATTPDHQSVKN